MIRSFDYSAVSILQQLVEEEKECYTGYELKAISKFLLVKSKSLVENEVKLEYLLSFN
jgi:hypothetical protein